MHKDYYQILGVDKAASAEEIKKAYRKLAHQYHPDKAGGNEAKFKEINEAYQMLSHQEKRAQYDRFGHGFDGFNFNFDPHSFDDLHNISDIFDAFFEGVGVRKKRRTYRRGADVEISFSLTLEDAFRGAEKTLSAHSFIACAGCDGKGYDVAAGTEHCKACDGRGEIRENKATFFGNFTQVKECEKCYATGEMPKVVCKRCKGSGRVRGEREISFRIVPGIADGQIVKLAKMGEAGERGADPGDLYVRIRITPHPVFARKGNDLFIAHEAKVTDVLLGKKIEIPTISGGTVRVVFPGGFRIGDNITIPGEGMPLFGTLQRGYLYIMLTLKTPKKISAKAKKLLEELDGEL